MPYKSKQNKKCMFMSYSILTSQKAQWLLLSQLWWTCLIYQISIQIMWTWKHCVNICIFDILQSLFYLTCGLCVDACVGQKVHQFPWSWCCRCLWAAQFGCQDWNTDLHLRVATILNHGAMLQPISENFKNK